MFKKLQQKWKVTGWQVLIILTTFAIGGSLTGFAGRKLMGWMGVNDGWFFLPVYILVITLLWPLMVLLVSIPFGQFGFFKRYLGRMAQKMGLTKSSSSAPSITNLAIFASGAGSNAAKIIAYFEGNPSVKVALIVSNKPTAGVLTIAAHHQIETLLIEKDPFLNGHHYLPQLIEKEIDFIVLAGFLWKVPAALVNHYPKRIINIHPALLPAYGGKGMYGKHVHEAVIADGCTESGITIHYADDEYDHGSIIFQAKCAVTPSDTAETLAQKIHQLEHLHFPAEIDKVIIALQKMG